MCGIAGFVDFKGHDRSVATEKLVRMTSSLIHRGPDEAGYYVDEHVALGHRRLAIVDVSSGKQPMATADGAVQIVFNGEIYNFRELRAQLASLGCVFRTRSDTEVILAAYLQWGESCAARLNGMFAFAIWDSRKRSMFLSRDRVGKKPLYYCRIGSCFAFASELKALRAVGLCGSRTDLQSLDCYMSLGYVPAPRTIYEDVFKLPSARTLVVTGNSVQERRYWDLSFGGQRQRTLDSAVEEFGSLLDDAVRCRLVSEVPLGAFLSGGLDSSLVVASMSGLLDAPVITNSIGFDDRDFSELPAAGSVSQSLRTNHHELVVKPDVGGILDRIAWHFDEPVSDSSAVPTWYLSQMARKTVTVALSGDGGDEAFGGYTARYLPHEIESRLRSALPPWVRYPLFGGLGAVWPRSARLPKPLRLKSIFENLSGSDAQAFYRDLIWLREDDRRALYSADFMRSLRGYSPFESVAPHYLRNDAPDALSRSQYADVNVYMTDDVLVKVDRMSMAHSLEVRCPLLDHRILEFAATLPPGLKLKGGQGKCVLRALAARRLPHSVQNLPKRGFSIPAARWLREDLRDMAQELIFARTGVLKELFDASKLQRLWNEHIDGSRDHNVVLWGVLMLGLWEEQSSLADSSKAPATHA